MNKYLLQDICDTVENKKAMRLVNPVACRIQGGDICQSYVISSQNNLGYFFVKVHSVDFYPAFVNELNNLHEIRKACAIQTPLPISADKTKNNDCSFLILEHLNLTKQGNNELLGKQLAQLHRFSHSHFGFYEDNVIGNNPQNNTPSTNWADFWVKRRLQPQLEMAYKNGFRATLEKMENRLLNACQEILSKHNTTPSLVHGDLWSGNAAFLANGTPVIFDPACYYGDREVDIAMTQLFGGFSEGFYQAYQQEWPLPHDVKTRRPLYNLYHQLNHLNLFGYAYLNACVNSIETIIQPNN